jgi:GNAT superfamily N-acetyltransferase
MKIREAVAADIPAIIALNDEVHGIHVRLFPEAFKPVEPAALAEWFSDRLDSDKHKVLVAEDADGLVAYLTLGKEERPAHLFARRRKCAYIDQVCVTERRRGEGIFQALLEKAGDVARGWGMSHLELSVWSDNTTAKKAFSRSGFQTYIERMKLLIDE